MRFEAGAFTVMHGQPHSLHRLSEAAYRTVFASAPDMCLALEGGTGRILRCNEVVRTTLGFAPGEVVGRSVLALAHPRSSADARQTWRMLAQDLSVPSSDVQARAKDGSAVDVRLTGAGVHDPSGQVTFGLALLRARVRSADDATIQANSPERLRALLYALSVAEERERRRIAAGLHDELGQLLAIAKLKLGRLDRLAPGEERTRIASELHEILDHAARSARSTTFELSSPVLHQLGLDAAIRSIGERMEDAYGIRFAYEGECGALDLPHETTVVLLRVVRELLFNVHKHAHASTVTVTAVVARDGLEIAVSDDGIGFVCTERFRAFTPAGGFGLFSAEAQVQAIGGRLGVSSAPGNGTCITAVVPLPSGTEPWMDWQETSAAAPRD